MRAKGFPFPSYENQQTPIGKGGQGTPGGLKPNEQWIRHEGKARRIKNLRQVCLHLLRSTDPEIVAALEKIRISTSTEPVPEYGMLFLTHKIWEIADSNGIPFPEATGLILATMTQMVQEHADGKIGSADSSEGSDLGNSGRATVESERQDSNHVPQRESGGSGVETRVQEASSKAETHVE